MSIKKALFIIGSLLVSVTTRAQYIVTDITGNATLETIAGLSASQLNLLSRIFSENENQLKSLQAIQRALEGGNPSGAGLSSLAAASSTGGGAGLVSSAAASGSSSGTATGATSSSGLGGLGGISGLGGLTGLNSNSTPTDVFNGVTGGLNTIKNGINAGGNLANGLSNADSLSLNNHSNLVSAIPGLGGFNIRSMFPQNGYLDVFMGMSPDQFKTAVTNPSTLLGGSLMNRLIGDVGGELEKVGGSNAAEIMFGARIASMSPEERMQNSVSIARDIADLMTARVVKNVEESSKRAATFSVMTKNLADQSERSDNLNAKISISNQQAALAAQIHIQESQDAAKSAAALNQQSSNQTGILSREASARIVKDSIGVK